ncbi:structural protein [Pseudomonas phage PaMx41]|uniref:Structural protein n=1 Tax=Pseudomonas phage PaMx41 TaxID=1815976 RepID=A0A1C8HQ42_BPPP4|nr:virion structural protein [Pseudomonas phage PaMx41]ANA48983.1 structural protein [Pseudomonas phage PaMx41]
MADSRGMYLDTSRSMLVIDPAKMPNNLGKATAEDTTDSSFPVIAYHGWNILPTPMGYKSAFGLMPYLRADPQPDDGNPLKQLRKQDLFTYQTINFYNLGVMLTEGGFWMYSSIGNYKSGIDLDLEEWVQIFPVPTAQDTLYLWTRCVIDNTIYIYHQGDPEIYVLADYGKIQQWKAKPNTTLVVESVDWQFGIVKFIPTFLNMEGQVGLFKADNRLGMWDTDNAIAWSSAVDKQDFKPDATTFAGVTKFASVDGQISMILQHGPGFIIYASRSISICTPITGTPEKFSGRAILNKTGVPYYFQATMGQPDTVHFSWTNSGLLRITNGNPEFIEPDVSNFLMNNFQVIRPMVINGSHLFISVANNSRDSANSRYAVLVYDGKGKPGYFNPPRYEYPDQAIDWLHDFIWGQLPEYQEQLPEYETIPPDNDPPPLAEQRPLIPCYEGYTFIPPSGFETIDWNTGTGTTISVPSIPSFRFPGGVYNMIDPQIHGLNQDTALWRYEAGPIVSPPGAHFIDKAGEEFAQIWTQMVTDLNAVRDKLGDVLRDTNKSLTNSGEMDFVGDRETCRAKPVPDIPPVLLLEEDPNTIWIPEAKRTISNLLIDIKMEIESNGCDVKVIATVADYTVETGWRVIDEGWQDCNIDDPDNYKWGYVSAPGVPPDTAAIGKRENLVKKVEGSEVEVTVFQCKCSGFGYFPAGGFSFRKTHSRSIFKPCSPTPQVTVITMPPNTIPDFPAEKDLLYPPYENSGGGFGYPNQFPGNGKGWIREPGSSDFGFPDTFPTWANIGKGFQVPYYPVYDKAYVLDLRLGKYGVYSDPHVLIWEALPSNRAQKIEQGNTQAGDYQYRVLSEIGAGAVCGIPLEWDGEQTGYRDLARFNNLPILLASFNALSLVRLGKIGYRRAGFTELHGISIDVGSTVFNQNDTCHVNIYGATDNIKFNPYQSPDDGPFPIGDQLWKDYSYWNPDDRNMGAYVHTNMFGFKLQGYPSATAEIPFLRTARWFIVELRGQFDISSIVLYGKPVGRLRFVSDPFTPT